MLNEFHTHKWMYDADSLGGQFSKAGFTDIRQMTAHDSRIQDIQHIEMFGRVSEAGLCIEGMKPAATAHVG